MVRRMIPLVACFLVAVAAAARAQPDNPLAEPKKSIEHQLKLLRAGDADKLRECFTPRVRDRVTKEAVDGAKATAGKATVEELVKDVAVAEAGGVKTAKVTMKNGRTLTTLVLTDGKWLADTIWFK